MPLRHNVITIDAYMIVFVFCFEKQVQFLKATKNSQHKFTFGDITDLDIETLFCITIVVWFYILVVDHYTTDPVL
jgi:hypothetical protein